MAQRLAETDSRRKNGREATTRKQIMMTEDVKDGGSYTQMKTKILISLEEKKSRRPRGIKSEIAKHLPTHYPTPAPSNPHIKNHLNPETGIQRVIRRIYCKLTSSCC